MAVAGATAFTLCLLSACTLQNRAATADKPAPEGCTADSGLSFVCGAEKPEDLKHIPGTRYIVTSGFSPGAGLKLLDTQTQRLAFWYRGKAAQIDPDLARYPDCETPPDPALFNARGLSLRLINAKTARLHVVNHGGRETVEIFDVRIMARNSPPLLRWRGCLKMPSGHVGNAVATYGDDTVLVSVLTRPGTTITDFEQGRNTGAIFQRAADDREFRMIPGTELPGNNGLETDRGDHGFFAISFGKRAVAYFTRNGEGGPVYTVSAPGFMPDNIHWNGDRLIAAGMNADEPACGGKRLIVDGVADKMLCARGWKVATFDPDTRRFTILAEGERNARFNGLSQALLLDNRLWLGSYQADRIAYRTFGAGMRQ